ncbi:hypothetical protein [Streptomyces sp. NBC_01012]|uniref:hypothetical protein n=1 Tax=Streptomyces sp. NBC_01012 TaxID=2903717 RepID=UPI002F909EAD|nr:hypothetical protein OG623_35010 [Streptomyces sp. NBC_01012]
MPKPIRMSPHAWVAAWAVLCAACLAATAKLNASSAPAPQPEKSVSIGCAERIADIEAQLAKAKQEGKGDGVLVFSQVQVGTEDNCRDDLHHRFRGDQ